MKKKSNTKGKEQIIAIAGGIAGGFVGNQLTNLMEEQLNKSGNANAGKIAPLGTLLVGSLVSMFAPDQFKSIGLGMTAVAGTETVEGLIAEKSTAPAPAPVQSANERVYANMRVNAGLSGIEEMEMLY